MLGNPPGVDMVAKLANTNVNLSANYSWYRARTELPRQLIADRTGNHRTYSKL